MAATLRLRCSDLLLSSCLGMGVWVWFAIFYRFHLHYQEEMQLFLFTVDYFVTLIVQPGGLARWIGEFFTQFGVDSFMGALPIALLLVWMRQQLVAVSQKVARHVPSRLYLLVTFLPPGLFALLYCNENVLLSGIVSVNLALAVFQITLSLRPIQLKVVAVPLLFLLLWWTTGVPLNTHYRYIYHPYPLYTVALAITLLAPFAVKYLIELSKTTAVVIQTVLLLAAAIALPPLFVDKDKEEVMAYSYYAQTGNWNRILALANKKTPTGPLTVATLNLALSQTGQMADRMFSYYQNGVEGLVPSFVKEYLPCQITGEIYFHLGLIQSARRLAFEGMEAIPDHRKSVRAIKRLAETSLISGDVAVAQKYLHILKQTLFYRSWAIEMSLLLHDSQKQTLHPLYGKLREMSPKEDFLFSEQEKEKMFGLLFVQNPGHRQAFEYLLAHCLLNNDLKRFGQYFDYGSTYLRYDPLPADYQNALQQLQR